MADLSNVPDDVKQNVEKMLADNPEFVAKFGNPLDASDPRNWSPSERKKRGVSAEDRLEFLELDVEGMQIVTSKLSTWMLEQQRKEMLEEMKKDPMGFLQKMLGTGDSSYAIREPGQAIAPDTIIPTVDGNIRADQIPGYRNEPGWYPSPDWADANCACPVHVEQRKAAEKNAPQIGNDDGFPTGFYL